MKKWLQNLSSAVMASLLAITLSGKAYADLENPQQPQTPAEGPMESVETASVQETTVTALTPAISEATAAASEPQIITPEVPDVTEPAPVEASVAEPEVPVAVAVDTDAPAVTETSIAVPAIAETLAVTEAPAAVPSATETATASAAPEAPAESFETTVAAPPTAAPSVSETPSEAPVVPEAPSSVETFVVGEISTAETTDVVSEVSAAGPEVSAAEIQEAVDTPAVKKVDVETAAENLGSDAPVIPIEETPAFEKDEQAAPDETNIVVSDVQKITDETIPEKAEQSVQEAAAADASFVAPIKPASPKKLSLARSAPPSGDESDASANLLSEPTTLMRTASLEENAEKQAEEQSKEQPEETSTRGTKSAETNDAAADNSLSQTADGSYVLVNHSGTEALSANGDITVLAAGFNRIGSISGNGTVTIAGTGILLVDSLQGNLDLLTFTDIYEQGSVAVFVKDGDRYVLANGSVPGLLDEQYEITNATLVMPSNTSLLLCGTGAMPEKDEEGNVTGVSFYYHGTDHGYSVADEEIGNAVEHTGILTIAQQAALIVEKGASIILENLKSLSGDTRHPELNMSNGGTLTVDGSIGNGGFVTITGTSQTLFGDGSMTASKIIVSNSAAIKNSQVSLSSQELYLNGSENYENLIIHNSAVHPGKGLDISGLTSSGSSMVTLQEGSDLNIKKVEGTLSVKGYSTEHTLTGDMEGSGELCFDSGFFVLPEGTELNDVKISGGGWGEVFDYAKQLNASSYIPLRIGPEQVKTPSDADKTIPVVGAKLEYINGEILSIERFILETQESITAEKVNGKWVLKKDDIEKLINDYKNECGDYSNLII